MNFILNVVIDFETALPLAYMGNMHINSSVNKNILYNKSILEENKNIQYIEEKWWIFGGWQKSWFMSRIMNKCISVLRVLNLFV